MRTYQTIMISTFILALMTPNASAAGCCVETYQTSFSGVSVVGEAVLYLGGDEIFRANQVAVSADKSTSGLRTVDGADPGCETVTYYHYSESVSGSIDGSGSAGLFTWNWLGLTFVADAEVISHGNAEFGVVGFVLDIPESEWVVAPGTDLTQVVVNIAMQLANAPDEYEALVDRLLTSLASGNTFTATAWAAGSGLGQQTDSGAIGCGL